MTPRIQFLLVTLGLFLFCIGLLILATGCGLYHDARFSARQWGAAAPVITRAVTNELERLRGDVSLIASNAVNRALDIADLRLAKIQEAYERAAFRRTCAELIIAPILASGFFTKKTGRELLTLAGQYVRLRVLKCKQERMKS